MVKIKAIVLAAGYATRLYPLTKNTPKPLINVGGKPIIEHIITKIEEIEEVDEIFIVTNNKFYSRFEEWLAGFKIESKSSKAKEMDRREEDIKEKDRRDAKAMGEIKAATGLVGRAGRGGRPGDGEERAMKKIKIINDLTNSNEDRLGSLGDVNFVLEKENIRESVLIIAGDNLFEFSLREFVEGHKRHNKSTVALYDVEDRELAKHYGIVGVGGGGRMIDFEEKPLNPQSTLASTGVYIYPPHILPMLKEFVKRYKNSDKAGNFLEWLHKEESVYCYITDKRWFDIGTIEQLEKAKQALER